MLTLLCLLRHGRATGHGPNAELTDHGIADIARLGRALAREGFAPAAVFCSPYLRAGQTARLLLAEVAPGLSPTVLGELTPESDPAAALAALHAHGLPDGRVLVVAHLPLLGLMAQALTGDDPGFSPGTLAEIELTGPASGVIRRHVMPWELTGE